MGQNGTHLDRSEVSRLLSDESTNGFVILAVCLNEYDDYFEVDFLETIARLREDFNAELTQDGENKLQALTVAMTTDAFENDPSVFDSVCKSLSTGDPDLDDPDDSNLNIAEMLWGVYEVRLATDEAPDFSPAVSAYMDRISSKKWGQSSEEMDDIFADLDGTQEELLIDLRAAGFEIDRLPEL